MCNDISDTATTLPLLDQQMTHINTAITNLSWNIPELQELLTYTMPEDDTNTTNQPPQPSDDNSSDSHNNLNSNETSETDNIDGTSTAINGNQPMPLNINNTEIHANIHI